MTTRIRTDHANLKVKNFTEAHPQYAKNVRLEVFKDMEERRAFIDAYVRPDGMSDTHYDDMLLVLRAKGFRIRTDKTPKVEPAKPATKLASAKTAAPKKAVTKKPAAKKAERVSLADTTKPTWRESFDKSVKIKALKVAKGGTLFREGTKRDLVYREMLKGTTIENLMEKTGWNKSVCHASLYEISELAGMRLSRMTQKGVNIYGMVKPRS